MLHLYLRNKNEHNVALRLDDTVKYFEVVERCSFQTNRLIFGLLQEKQSGLEGLLKGP